VLARRGICVSFRHFRTQLTVIPLVKLRPFLALICTTAAAFAQADNMLTAEEAAAGWKLLFDGKTLIGLRGVQKADPLKAGWTIENGELSLPKDFKVMGKITGGDLVTAEQFTDFEFSFEFKMGVSTNAGIRYLVRGTAGGSPAGCEYQIIDDVHHPEGLKGGPIRRTGALDAVIAPIENKRLHEAERWNEGRIVVLGNHAEHWLNGQKVVEYDLGSKALADAVKAAKAKVPSGFGMKMKSPIVLLDQGDQIAFRNLKVRPLVPAQPRPAASPQPLTAPAVVSATPMPVAPPAPTPFVRPVAPAPTPYPRPVAPVATPFAPRAAATPAPARPLTPPTLE
jgi:hypothetical protein